MPQGRRLDEETIQQIREAKIGGATNDEIVQALKAEGRPISARTVKAYTRGITPEIPPTGVGVRLPPPSGKRMSKAAIDAESAAQEALAQETLDDLAERKRLRKKREQVELREMELDARQRSLELALQEAELRGKGAEAQTVQSELLQLRRDKEKAERERSELERKLELAEYMGKLDDLQRQIGEMKQVGRSQFDFLSQLTDQIMPLLGQELQGIRGDLRRLTGQGQAPPAPPASPVGQGEAEWMAELMRTRERLIALAQQGPEGATKPEQPETKPQAEQPQGLPFE